MSPRISALRTAQRRPAVARRPRDGRELKTIQARLRLTDVSLQRLLARTGSTSAFILSSVDGRTTVRVELEVSSVPGEKLVLGRRRIVLDWVRSTISRRGNRATLSRQELRLLAALADAAPFPARREQLVRRVWHTGRRSKSDGELALAVAVYSLRKRFAAIGIPDAITTVRQFGYQLSL